MISLLKKIPLVRSILRKAYYKFIVPFKSFSGSTEYWKSVYRSGGNSGAGSYSKLAEFKAEVLNDFVKEKGIDKVIEYGCGDGNQLRLAKYPSYIGFDVSPEAILQCQTIFAGDTTKSFKLVDAYANETAPLTLSLDVIYHLVEDNVFHAYIKRLFDSSTRYVIVYSSNKDTMARYHVRHRKFTKWIEQNKPEWKLIKFIPNKYPYKGDDPIKKSFADFYIYEKA